MRFGAIADDYTGGSDLAGMLAGQGVPTLMHFGVPRGGGAAPAGYQAAVVCLKSRSIEAARARAMSAEALAWLERAGARQIQFKYCSTFDSTDQGNIGPVLDELLDRTGVPLATAIPALPVNGRTQYFGHLFVNGVPLNESPMRHHPLNPMTDANLVRHLARQTSSRVGLVTLDTVRAGAPAIQAALGRLGAEDGVRMALVDAVAEADLASIAEAVSEARLLSGGSGIAAHLVKRWSREPHGPSGPAPAPPKLGARQAGVLLLAGSCSAATLEQLAEYTRAVGDPGLRIDEAALARPEVLAHEAERRVREGGRALVYSSAAPDARMPAGLAASIEHTLAAVARTLVREAGVRRVMVAGGETAGAVVDALGITSVEVLRVLAPGVPALATVEGTPVGLVLKSGNFGGPRFFAEAAEYLEALE